MKKTQPRFKKTAAKAAGASKQTREGFEISKNLLLRVILPVGVVLVLGVFLLIGLVIGRASALNGSANQPTPTPQIVYVTPEPTPTPEPHPNTHAQSIAHADARRDNGNQHQLLWSFGRHHGWRS